MKTEHRFLNDLYTIKSIHSESDNKFIIQVEINQGHPVFAGHFPGNPILPGVCTIQILKELIAVHFKSEVSLVRAGTIKYLSFINPVKHNLIDFDIDLKEGEDGKSVCSATIHFENITFCSFRGEFRRMIQ